MLGTKTLGSILSESETIAREIKEELDLATLPWGVLVERVEVKDVMPLGRSHGLKPGDLFWEYNGDRIFPHDGYLPRMRADQAQGLVQPVIVYRPDVGFFPIYMQPDKQGWGVSTRPVTRVPGQESEPTGD